MTYHKTKTEIINLIISEAKDDPDFPWKDVPVDKLIFDWFVTGRSGQGLRLTDAAKVAFERAKIAHYDFDFTPSPNKVNAIKSVGAWARFTLILDKKVKCPYYVGTKLNDKGKKQTYIRFYDHKIAMMVTLYGDLESYLDSVK
jgi:hypothetical protein